MNKNDIGMFPIPETKNVILNGDYKIGVSKNTKYPEAAKEFLKFLFENDRYSNAVNIKSNLKDSNSTIEMIRNINNYDVTINFEGNLISQKSQEENLIHAQYSRLKSAANINYNFVQQYVISADTNNIRKNTNRIWTEENMKISETTK